MTVEIVGKDEIKYKYVSCCNCASKLRYVLNDRRYLRDYGGGGDWYIKCPSCSTNILVG